MTKITDYPELTTIDPEADYVVIAYNGLNYKVLAGNISFPAPHNKMIPRISDFTNILQNVFAPDPLYTVSTENNHPGYISGTREVGINDGVVSNFYKFIGGEAMEVVFRGLGGASYGIFSSVDNQGISISIDAAGNVFGVADDGALLATSSSYVISAGVWYRAKVSLNIAKTQASYFLYDMSGNLLWSDSLSSHIPTAAWLDPVITDLSATRLIDWAAVYNTSVLVR